MKFRGKMSSVLSIRQFSQLVHLLARCSKQLVIRVCPDKINFVVCERESRIRNTNGPTAHCELPKDPYFDEYGMEGLSPEANEIFLEIPSDALAGVMNSIRTASVSSLKIKLTKKNVPCLTIEVELGQAGSGQLCTHDIPVDMIKRDDWGEYKEPDLPNFDVSFGMPELRIIQRSLDRMKNMSNKLVISASKYGQLYFSIDTMAVKSTVKFKEPVKVFELGDEGEGPASEDMNTQINSFSVEVDIKSLLQLIPQESMKPNSFICSILHERLLHFYYIYGEISVQYFLPCSAS